MCVSFTQPLGDKFAQLSNHVSAFSGHDQRLERMMESSLMVMEAFEGHEDKFTYDIVGHSGEEAAIPFVMGGTAKKGGQGGDSIEKVFA